MSQPAKLKLAATLIEGNGKHPSPNAPKHLLREKQELLPYEDTCLWFTEAQLALLQMKFSEAQLDYWIHSADDYLSDPKNFKKYKSHYRCIKNWHDMKTQRGLAWAELEILGEGYFFADVIKKAQR